MFGKLQAMISQINSQCCRSRARQVHNDSTLRVREEQNDYALRAREVYNDYTL